MASTLLPLSATFESRVELKLHDAFLATAGVLQADTIAQVELVTVNKRIHFSGGATTTRASTTTTTTSSSSSSAAAGSYRCAYIMNREVMGRTPLRLFTAHPNIETVVAFNVDDNRLATQLAGAGTTTPADAPKHNNNNNMAAVEDFIVITMRDASGQHFYGEAWAPFSPHCANEELQPLRVMLRPRHAHDPHDPLCRQDVAQLIAHQVDDFGFVNVSWKVAMIHRGGVRMAAEAPAEMCGEPSFPLGIALRATWMTPCTALQRGAHHNVSVEFGGAGRFLFAGDDAPLFLTLRSATQAPQRAIFHCTIQSVMSPANSRDVVVPITLPPLHGRRDGLDRDVRWSAPVRSPQGEDFGLLMVCIRISSQPMDGAQPPPCAETRCPRINEPQHMERFSHVVQPWPGHADRPHAPCGVYGPLQWESEQHMNEAATRAWKHKCVVEAAPTVEHVRHVWDVLMGHAPSLDPGVARVGALFHNRPTQELTAEELKELMIALAFHATGINAAEAARFAFIALRRDVEDAVALEEVCYLFQHCLLPNTIEMSSGEIRRWVHDVFGGEGSGAVKFGDFSQHVLLNYAWWAALGVPVRVEHSASCAQKQHAMHLQAEVSRFADPLVAISNNNNNNNATEVASAAAPPPPTSSSSPPRAEDVLLPPTSATSKDDVEWRTFIIRVQSSTTTTKNKCFSVTAHINDRVSDVMSMVEGSTNILAARQEWRWGEKIVDPATRVGQTTIGLASAMKMGGSGTQEVVVAELEESVVLHFVYKTKRWHEKFFMKDKIIKLRAAVQRRTLIPLSRCTLRYEGGAAGGGEVLLQDRHAVSHYKLRSGDVVVVLGD